MRRNSRGEEKNRGGEDIWLVALRVLEIPAIGLVSSEYKSLYNY